MFSVKDLDWGFKGVMAIAYICIFIVATQVKPNPASEASKKQQVEEMFDNISPRYDFLNHFLSLGIDIIWRRKAIKELKSVKPRLILDVATGTGDFAFESIDILQPEKIVGVDISAGMLEVAKKKINERNLGHVFSVQLGDSEGLKFDDNTFDAITVAPYMGEDSVRPFLEYENKITTTR